jgi:hypothetical protein
MNPYAANLSAVELWTQADQLAASLQTASERASAAHALDAMRRVVSEMHARAAAFTALAESALKTPA